jgi:hypothetical protein
LIRHFIRLEEKEASRLFLDESVHEISCLDEPAFLWKVTVKEAAQEHWLPLDATVDGVTSVRTRRAAAALSKMRVGLGNLRVPMPQVEVRAEWRRGKAMARVQVWTFEAELGHKMIQVDAEGESKNTFAFLSQNPLWTAREICLAVSWLQPHDLGKALK